MAKDTSYKMKLIPLPLRQEIVDQMKRNRNRMNPEWSLATYLEHIVAQHTLVIERRQADESTNDSR